MTQGISFVGEGVEQLHGKSIFMLVSTTCPLQLHMDNGIGGLLARIGPSCQVLQRALSREIRTPEYREAFLELVSIPPMGTRSDDPFTFWLDSHQASSVRFSQVS